MAHEKEKQNVEWHPLGWVSTPSVLPAVIKTDKTTGALLPQQEETHAAPSK